MPAVLALALLAATPTPRPTSGALRRAFEAGCAALVDVQSARGKGFGVLVGSGGEVLTSVDFVGLEDAKVKIAGQVHPAQVRFAEAELGVALLSVRAAGPFHAVAVRAGGPPSEGWVVAVARGKAGQPVPHLGRI